MIAVSIGPQAWIVSELLPDSVAEIIQLLPPGADPETFEPSIGTLRDLADARVWLSMNTPGFEESLHGKIKANFPDLEIVDVSEGIERNVAHYCDNHGHNHSEHSGQDGHLHDESEGDPHLLTSLRNAEVMTVNISKALQSRFPENAEEIAKRSQVLNSRLQALDDSIAIVLKEPGRSGAFLIEHPSLGYFARDYGLIQIPIQSGGKEPTPAQIAEAFAAAGTHNAKVIFTEKEHPSQSASTLARQAGLQEVEISLYSSDYLNSIRNIVSGL